LLRKNDATPSESGDVTLMFIDGWTLTLLPPPPPLFAAPVSMSLKSVLCLFSHCLPEGDRRIVQFR
jgi:hypothetical protein